MKQKIKFVSKNRPRNPYASEARKKRGGWKEQTPKAQRRDQKVALKRGKDFYVRVSQGFYVSVFSTSGTGMGA